MIFQIYLYLFSRKEAKVEIASDGLMGGLEVDIAFICPLFNHEGAVWNQQYIGEFWWFPTKRLYKFSAAECLLSMNSLEQFPIWLMIIRNLMEN